MKKYKKIILSILGAMDVLVKVMTPIFLIWLWLAIFGIKNHWSSYVLILLGIGSSLFRAIRIGWLKK